MEPAKQTIKVKLQKHPTMDATLIKIPFDVEAVFGRKRVPVKATINGAIYYGSIVRMGGEYMLGIPKSFREATGIRAGDNIVVTVEADFVERMVELPPELTKKLLRNPNLKKAWERLSFTVKKQNARAIADAKRPATRARRLSKTLELLESKAD